MRKTVFFIGLICCFVFTLSSCRSPKVVSKRDISTSERFVRDKSGQRYEQKEFDTYDKGQKRKKVVIP